MRTSLVNQRLMSRIMVFLLMLVFILPGFTPVVVAEVSEAPQVTVSFDPQGGTGTMAPIFCNSLDEVTLPENAFIAPEGKAFKGWEIEGQGYAPGTDVTVLDNTMVKAVWQNVEDDPSEVNESTSVALDSQVAEVDTEQDVLTEEMEGEHEGITNKQGEAEVVLGELNENADIESGLQDPKVRADVSARGNVASVNGTSYETLQAAIDAAAKGDTVNLNVDTTEEVTINKSLILDLSGHTLTTSPGGEDNPAITITNRSFPTIQNGTIVGGRTTWSLGAGAISVKTALFNLQNLTITGCTGKGYAIQLSAIGDFGADLSMNINNLTICNNASHVISGNVSNNIIFTDCHFDNNLPEGSNRLLTIGGRGTKTFNNCTFLNNKAQGITDLEAEFKGCRFEGNECQDQSTIEGSNITLQNSVVKNNTCTHPSGVAGVDATNLILRDSAVYNNRNTAGGMNDLGKDCQNIDATQMKDPTDPTRDFRDYVVDDKGTVLKIVQIFEAEIGETKYKLLTDAVEASQDGDTIKLIHTNEAGDIAAVQVDELWIKKDIAIDLNGRDVVSHKEKSFCLSGEAGKLSLINSSDQAVVLGGSLFNKDMDSTLQIGEKINLAGEIYHNEKTIIDGRHKSLKLISNKDLNGGKTMPVIFGDSFEYTGEVASLVMSLAESQNALNAPQTAVDDIVIAHQATADLADKISLYGITNPLVKVIFQPNSASSKFGDLVVRKTVSSTIYLNGESGDDANDGGTKDTAVKTFAKAKELAEELAPNNEKVVIYVCGTVGVDTTETWEFSAKDKIAMYREPTFSGNLIQVGPQGDLTLQDMTIDGNKHHANAGANSLIKVKGGTLTISSGASLQNNQLTDMEAYPPAAGGAVYAREGATVNLEGGTISGNTAVWGGGIFANNATVNIKDGLITQNHAVNAHDDSASGGGIATWYQSVLNIEGGTISYNTSERNGGGVSLGVSRVMKDGRYSELHMSGGSFIGNTAQSSGGGLFVQGGIGEGYARAHVTGGIFQENMAYKGFFGGGGIYVNGGHNWSGYKSGELYLTNALITNNTADENGGGYAACPTTLTVISAKNGAAIIANKAPSGQEIHINASVWWQGSPAEPKYDLADSMLGGTPYNWKYDDGTEVPLQRLHGRLSRGTELNLKNEVPADVIASAQNLAKVIIRDNYAGKRGGGIGSNGDVYIGDTSESVELTVHKIWNDNNDVAGKRPQSVKIGLYRALEGSEQDPIYIGYNPVAEDAAGEWSTTFKNLPKANEAGKLFVYSVKEAEFVNSYTSAVTGDAETGFIVTNTLDNKTVVEGSTTWDDNNDQAGKRPKSITIRLWKNGVEIASQIVTEADGWAWSFRNLAKYENGELITYTITEDPIDGYSTVVSGYNVTNRYSSPEPTLPTTPTESMETTTPTKPTGPTTSTELPKITGLTKLTTPIKSTEQTTPTEPAKPTTPTGPTEPTDPALLPQVGDDSGAYLWLGILCMSVGVFLIFFRRKHKMLKR